MTNLAVEIAGVRWNNPITTGAGTFVPWGEYGREIPVNRLGALTVKSISSVPWEGNPKPWLADTPCGKLNSIGIRNPGVERFIEEDYPRLIEYDVPLIVSIAGHTLQEFVAVTERLVGLDGISAIEINMSCPNTNEELMAFGQNPAEAKKLVDAVKQVSPWPTFAKLTPNCADIVAAAQACVEGGADAITMGNTFLAMSVDINTGLPKTGTRTAGLSGPAIRPIALRMVWDIFEAVDVPIIAVGGVDSAEAALEFIMVGATGVGIGQANLDNPMVAIEVIEGIEAYCRENNIEDINELRGLAHRRWAEKNME